VFDENSVALRLKRLRTASKRMAERPLARGLDPRGGAFRLHIAVRPPLSVAALSLRLSPRPDLKAARLSLAVYHCRLATRRDTVRHLRTDETTNAANPPRAPRDRLHRVEMRVVHVSRKVPIVAYRVLPMDTKSGSESVGRKSL
jgi:hypothetical protein